MPYNNGSRFFFVLSLAVSKPREKITGIVKIKEERGDIQIDVQRQKRVTVNEIADWGRGGEADSRGRRDVINAAKMNNGAELFK